MARNLNDLIKITDSGFDIAIFPEIRDETIRFNRNAKIKVR